VPRCKQQPLHGLRRRLLWFQQVPYHSQLRFYCKNGGLIATIVYGVLAVATALTGFMKAIDLFLQLAASGIDYCNWRAFSV